MQFPSSLVGKKLSYDIKFRNWQINVKLLLEQPKLKKLVLPKPVLAKLNTEPTHITV
jgi:hypothetical protein